MTNNKTNMSGEAASSHLSGRKGKRKHHRRRRKQSAELVHHDLSHPFFKPEQSSQVKREQDGHPVSQVLRVKFDGIEHLCLDRDFPGEVLVEQLGEISGRYFAPPHQASAPAFLRENSWKEKDAARMLGIGKDELSALIKAGHLGYFTLDGRLLLWRSDIETLKREGFLDKLAAAVATGPPGKKRRDTAGPPERRWQPIKRPRRREEKPPETSDLVLDDFQIEASVALKEGLSVLVSAPTGNGKTLVAEMLARDVMAAGLGMIYTSPLKALSNQKYREFKELFGEAAVGLVTGDISINSGAPLLIMTTEIFRNWCLSEPEQLSKISYVVFDEIHYLDDPERGTTWEESILFAPPHVKILGLSATVPNIAEMADWIGSVRGGNVVVILDHKRRVPLAIQWILPDGRTTGETKARQEVAELADQLKTLRGKRHWSEG